MNRKEAIAAKKDVVVFIRRLPSAKLWTSPRRPRGGETKGRSGIQLKNSKSQRILRSHTSRIPTLLKSPVIPSSMSPSTQQRKKFGQGSDLKDTETFPPFHECPHINDLNLKYYPDKGGDPVRHWCFLGEVIQVSYVGRLFCDVTDVQGNHSIITFYDNSESFLLGKPMCKPGYTVAVLYGVRHDFQCHPSAIRVDNSKNVRVREEQHRCRPHLAISSHHDGFVEIPLQILPCSLKSLFSANEKIRSPLKKKCAAASSTCDKTEDLKACSGCNLVRYCGKVGQKRSINKSISDRDFTLL